jgi:hypothetical protein
VIENLIVFSALAFALVFFAAWLLSPRLRMWLEKPKYRFQANVREADVQNWKQRLKGDVRR